MATQIRLWEALTAWFHCEPGYTPVTLRLFSLCTALKEQHLFRVKKAISGVAVVILRINLAHSALRASVSTQGKEETKPGNQVITATFFPVKPMRFQRFTPKM